MPNPSLVFAVPEHGLKTRATGKDIPRHGLVARATILALIAALALGLSITPARAADRRDNPFSHSGRPGFTGPGNAASARNQGQNTDGGTPAQPDDADARIGAGMQKAAGFLLSQFNGPELAGGTDLSPTYRSGLHALCVYSLLIAGQSLPDPRLSIRGKLMSRLIDAMKSHALTGGSPVVNDPVTYARSLRALALSVYDRPEDRRALKADVDWLVAAQTNGGYTYDDRYAPAHSRAPAAQVPWDNSNSQYGVLGAWAGAEVAVEVPTRYWRAVQAHWKSTQLKDGRWPYSTYDPHVSLAMTCGGIASLLITHDYLDAPMLRGAVGRDPFPGALGKGLAWLEEGNNSTAIPNPATFYMGYDLYALERVGLASGFKFFGTHDWYHELADKALSMQFPDGGFAHANAAPYTLIDTAYTLLFLARGRSPVFMDKLRFGRSWCNRPRDIANLTRFAAHDLERPFNWQVVSIERPWPDWLDSPVLYIASQQPPQFTDEEYARLRSFVNSGGLIFTQADAGSAAFNKWVPTLVKKVCPNYELQTLAPDDPLFSVYYRIPPPHPKMQAVSNGSRLLIVHSPSDLSAAWQQRDDKMFPAKFHLGVNVFIYAAGKRDFRNRLQSPYVPQPPGVPARTIPVIRVKYAGNWDPEPYAWVRFGRMFRNQSGDGIGISDVDAKDLAAQGAPLADLTGTAAYRFTDEQIAGIRNYVNAGGVLFIDACGGENHFANSVRRQLIPRAFPNATPSPIPPGHPIFAGLTTGTKLSGLRLRPYAADKLGRAVPFIQMMKIGKGYVVFTPLDVTSGLLGTNTWGIMGYDSRTSARLMVNLVKWAQSVRDEDVTAG